MTSPRPAPERAVAAALSLDDLDHRIALAEAAVRARDARVVARSRALVQGVERGVRRHAGTAAGVGLGVAALLWWFRRHRRSASPAAPPPSQPGPRPDDLGEVGLLAGLLPLVWPWLPERWRKLVSPATLSSVLATVVPVARRWWQHRRPKAPPAA